MNSIIKAYDWTFENREINLYKNATANPIRISYLLFYEDLRASTLAAIEAPLPNMSTGKREHNGLAILKRCWSKSHLLKRGMVDIGGD